MRKPKYGLLEILYFFKLGELHKLKVDSITIATDGLSPFNSTEYHNQIFYLDEWDIGAPESLCFRNPDEALNAEILRLEKSLETQLE